MSSIKVTLGQNSYAVYQQGCLVANGHGPASYQNALLTAIALELGIEIEEAPATNSNIPR